jgi:hypothetical protein
MIELTPAGLEQILATFAQLVPETKKQVVRGLADVAFATAQDQVDTHTQTGALARSLRLKSDGEGGWIIGHDPQIAPYAPFVHWGTRAHEIRAKDKQALKFPHGDIFWFFWGPKSPQERAIIMRWMKKEAPGDRAFFKWPHHPGYAGDPWLVRAADEAIRQFDAIVRRVQLENAPSP